MLQFLDVTTATYTRKIAFHHLPSINNRGALMWLGGYHSQMSGIKATSIATWAETWQLEMIRFDYSGMGHSSGSFAQGTVSIWLEEALSMYQQLTHSTPPILIGSSMGAWISLLMYRYLHKHLPDLRPKAMVLIAPAVDFTAYILETCSAAMKHTLNTDGVLLLSSTYAQETLPFYQTFLDDGQKHLLLNQQQECACPIDILHGQNDPDIPLWLAQKIGLNYPQVTLKIIEAGDHRLSRATDLAQIITAIQLHL